MQLVWAERSYPITGGILVSVLFHVLLALLIVLGVPSFFKPEVLETPPTIELATLSDITAAPKVDKQGKPDNKPKTPPAPETKKETKPEPPKPVPPTPAASPPPTPEQQAAVIPDKPLEKLPDEKKPEPKPEEKKKEEKKTEKPKIDKKQQDAMTALLNSTLQDTPAPETPEKPKKNAAPAPAQPTVGQQTANISDVPLTMAESDGIAQQIQPNWNIDIGALPGDPHQYMAWLRVTFGSDGTVQAVEYLEPERVASDQRYRYVAETCKRAFAKTQRITFPQGKEQPSIRFGCDPALMVGY